MYQIHENSQTFFFVGFIQRGYHEYALAIFEDLPAYTWNTFSSRSVAKINARNSVKLNIQLELK